MALEALGFPSAGQQVQVLQHSLVIWYLACNVIFERAAVIISHPRQLMS